MRVLVVTNMYPPHHLGGYELSCQDTVERFVARGHDVTVLTTTMRLDGVEDVATEGRPGGVRRTLEMYWRDHEIVRPSWRERLAIERGNQRVLAETLDDVRPDVVSCWNMGALSMGLLTTVFDRGLPSVLVVCDDWLVSGPRIDPWVRRGPAARLLAPAVRLATGVPSTMPDLSRADACCFVSDSVRRTAYDNTPWRFRHATVTGSGIDAGDFPVVEGFAPKPWSGKLLFTGRVEVRKGIETLLRALPLLDPSTTLDVVGPVDGAYRARLDRLQRELGIDDRVVFSTAERAELREHYRAADAFVFPSEWAEPFGLVPIEAMACGCPVLATGAGGSAEFLRDGRNCLLFPAGDAEALAATVRRLAVDPGERARIVEGGAATARTLTTDRLADVLEEWHLAAADRFAHGEPPARPLQAPLDG